MLQMVALPVVADATLTPSPKYSMTALVPPLTVRIPASFRMTSLGAAQPLSGAGQPDADEPGEKDLPREAGHDIDGVRAADT